MSQEPSSKRRKLSEKSSLNRDISPPPLRRQVAESVSASRSNSDDTSSAVPSNTSPPDAETKIQSPQPNTQNSDTLIISSPFKLTEIRDLTRNKNIDTITITDILKDPLIREIWSFNFMHDLEWMVTHLDDDTKHHIDIKIIHGNWKKEDPGRLQLEAEKQKLGDYNIELITAYLPDPFGTHHTKMMVLFYHDDTAEVVIHTANMIPFDWTNMTQAVWRSPRLPLFEDESTEKREGVGYVFKEGLMAYLKAYGWRTERLIKQLRMYDFRDVRAVFVGHVPGDHPITGLETKLFGWGKVKRVLMKVGRGGGHGINKAGKAIYQCSSVGTLGESYFDSVIYPVFSTHRPNSGPLNAFTALRSPGSSSSPGRPNFALVFPTVENVRTCVNGWNGGSPIFMKSNKPTALAQIRYLRPMLARWGQPPASVKSSIRVEAERGKATPHIKTYNLFSPPKVEVNDSDTTDGEDEGSKPVSPTVAMDWAMITSANLSKQAWGNPAKGSTTKIQSYEAGVLIHPALFNDLLKDDEGYVQMYGIGGKDWITDDGEQVKGNEVREEMDGKWRIVKVGVRLPYDYPLKRYEQGDQPWCSDQDYGNLRDWKDMTWPPRLADILKAEMGYEVEEYKDEDH
ncbi:hypothetical protein ABW19_dt0205117 [Dactylella cylindrospora]|nr:hypothetical protein ABW19_dt0205117 [Dactylella cylindrospora]